MPKLPSGLEIGLDLLATDMGENWFSCPPGHFWYWLPDAQPPYPRHIECTTSAVNAKVPESLEELEKFIVVLFKEEEIGYYWTGEFLSEFPKYIVLNEEDKAAFNAWLEGEQVQVWLAKQLNRLEQFAGSAQNSSIIPVFTSSPPK